MNLIFLNTWHTELRNELRAYITERMADTDVFCFQEAMADEHVLFDVLLTDYQKFSVEKLFDGTPFGNVIYVRKGIAVVDSGSLFIDEDGIGLANFVVLKNDDAETAICNVHGIPYPGHKLDTPERLEQSRMLIEHFADHKRVVIAGDFNLLPEAESVKMFSKHGYDDLIGRYGIKTTRNELAFQKYPGTPQYHADYAFVSSKLETTRFAVPSDVVSDHQPLELTLN